MKLREWGAFLLLAAAWGASFLWIKIVVQEIGPVTLVALRLLIAAAGLMIVMTVRRPRVPRERSEWLALAAVGLTNPALPFVLISWGEQFIESGVAAILNGATPLFTLLIAHAFLRDERISLPKVAGLLSGLVGVVLLVSRDLGADVFASSLLGQLAVLAAAASYAVSSVVSRRYLVRVSPLVQAFVAMTFADLLIWLAALGFESPVRLPRLPLSWLGLVWLGLLGTFLAYLLFFYLIQSVGATRTMMVTYLLPVIGVSLGVIFLRERLDWPLAAGTLLVVGGVWIVNARWRTGPAGHPQAASD